MQNKNLKYPIYISIHTLWNDSCSWTLVHPTSFIVHWKASTSWLESTCDKLTSLDINKKGTPIYIMSHSWWSESEWKQGLSGKTVDLRDRIVAKHRCGEGYITICAALNLHQCTVAFIILKWKRFGTTNSLPRSGHPHELSNERQRALVRQVTKNPMLTMIMIQRSFVEMDEQIQIQKHNHHCSTPPNRPLW